MPAMTPVHAVLEGWWPPRIAAAFNDRQMVLAAEGVYATAGQAARFFPAAYCDEYPICGPRPFGSSAFSPGLGEYTRVRTAAPPCGDHNLPRRAVRPGGCAMIGGRAGVRAAESSHAC